MEYLVHLLRVNQLDYYWDTVRDNKYDRDIDYLVIGKVAVLMTYVQRCGAEDIERIVEGIVNAKTENEL